MQLLVLGMHRSGTSAVARLLNMMGAYFAPEDMAMPATHANPKGYWERKDICAIHDEMLDALGLSWHNLADFSRERLQNEGLLDFERRMQDIILHMDAQRPWMAKDPRFCLFLPLWEKFLEVPVYIHVYRHPLEIARSLQTREIKQAVLTGTALHPFHAANYPVEAVDFPLSLGIALWEKYTLHSIQDAKSDIPCIWISYHELMTTPVETVQSLFASLQEYEVKGLRLPAEKEILAHLESKLHRQKHQADEANALLNTQQQQLLTALQEQSVRQNEWQLSLSQSAQETLKQHKEKLATAQHLIEQQNQFEQLQNAQRQLQESLKQEQEQWQKQQEKTTQTLTELNAQKQHSDNKLNAYKAYLNTSLLNLAENQAELADVTQQLEQQCEQHQHTQSELNEYKKSLAQREELLAETQAALGKVQQEGQQLAQHLDNYQQQLAQVSHYKNQALHYLNALEVDIEAVFKSLSWRIGRGMTRLIFALLLRKPSASAQEHIQAIRQQIAQLKAQEQQYQHEAVALPPSPSAAVSTPAVSEASHAVLQALKQATHNPNDYAAWEKKFDSLSGAQRRSMVRWLKQQKNLPLMSIIMPTYNSSPSDLKAAIESVCQQLYPHWELCIADDASTQPQVKQVLHSYEQKEARIKVCYRSQNGHISAASNSALEMAEGAWITFLDHDDELAETALFWVYKAILDAPDAQFFYSDEDKITADGERHAPHFKPAWNPDLFLSYNYLNHLSVYRAEQVREVGGLREGFEGAQDYDLALRVTERLKSEQICHIPRILYHWRVTETSTAGQETQKPYALQAAQKAIAEHFERCGIQASVSDAPELLGANRVTYDLPKQPPLVSIIIPTYNGVSLMRMCINSLRQKTTYPHYEILIVDNNSNDPAALLYFDELEEKGWARVLKYPHPFNFAAINNEAVKHADGEILCLLNNDIEVISPTWLSEMVGHALRPEIGAVGARLWYPNNTLQHGGVIIGLGGVAGHSHKYLSKGDAGYMGRTVVSQNLSAATAACLVLRKAVYQQVEGMNEEHLKVAFNDVDFCLRIGEQGLRIVWTPYAELYHHESISRGQEDSPEKIARFRKEINYMKMRWQAPLSDDLAYSPNLTLDTENFAYAWPPRATALEDALSGHVTVRHGAFSALDTLPRVDKSNALPPHSEAEEVAKAAPPPQSSVELPLSKDVTTSELETLAASEETPVLPIYQCLHSEQTLHGVQIRPFLSLAQLPANCSLVLVDAQSRAELVQAFAEIPAEQFLEVQQVCNLDQQDLPMTAQDFIICHDELSRVANPIKVLQRLFASLKSGGYLIVSVPNKKHTFNRYRPLSTFADLQRRYEIGQTEVDDEEYAEFLRHAHPSLQHFHPLEMAKPLRQARQRREAVQVWDADSFAAFMQQALKLLDIQAESVPYETASQPDNTNVVFIWKKG